MGLNIAALQFIDKCLAKIGEDIAGKRICMYGNLYLAKGTDEIQEQLGTKLASAYFLDRGASAVIMLDINKKDGALPVNLNEPISNPRLLSSFDILIDGGTSEHVKSQFNCWMNAFCLCKPGGLMFHFLPQKDHWLTHGLWGYPLTFFTQLVKLSNYTAVYILQNDFASKLKKERLDLAFACFRKEYHSEFPSKKDFRIELEIQIVKRKRGKGKHSKKHFSKDHFQKRQYNASGVAVGKKWRKSS